MNRWLRLGGWAVIALAALWALVKVLSIVFGIVSWLVSTLVSLVVLGVLLYVGYLAVSRFFGGSGGAGDSGGSRTREREKIFE